MGGNISVQLNIFVQVVNSFIVTILLQLNLYHNLATQYVTTGGTMKRLFLIGFLTLAGCAMSIPMHSFAPTTTAEGVQGWTLAYKDYTPDMVNRVLETEMGKHHCCPNGWTVAKSSKVDKFDVIEGKCK